MKPFSINQGPIRGLENMEGEEALIDQIFDFMVRDFSKHVLTLYSKPSGSELQKEMAFALIKSRVVNDDGFSYVWDKYVYATKDVYEMK